jgi:hypothetical protein
MTRLEAKYTAQLAMTGAAAAAAAVLIMASPSRLAVALPMGLMGLGNLIAAKCGKQDLEVTGSELATSLGMLAEDYAALFGREIPEAPLDRIPLRRRSENDEGPVDEDAGIEWYNKSVLASNLTFLGSGGSGKSSNGRYACDRIAAEFGLDAFFKILSSHHERDPDDPLDLWFPGADRDEVEKLISKDKAENMRYLRAFANLLRYRRENEITKAKAEYKFLVIDDYRYQFEKDDLQEAGEIIASIVEEGRKYNLRLVLLVHSSKVKNSKLDPSVLWNTTCFVFQSALIDPTMKALWPHQIQGKVSVIADQLGDRAIELGGQWRTAFVLPGPLDNLDRAMVRTLPDRKTQGVLFETIEQTWLEEASEKILAAAEDGKVGSFTAACRVVGLDGSMQKTRGQYRNPQVKELREWFEETFSALVDSDSENELAKVSNNE